ncbi:DUF5060 domain-containing protein [Desertihabitans aurantiacus]|uniref:DUF5060 domain-containing protein n=1 Tax=Desertihabitans aurantiacus TaxID=2282477 RepID=UPI000DF85690|nr:DUF5060 domain-containing protein [Desertihabitans aurantiacus]
MTAQVERWGVHEIRLEGPSEGNPFTDVELVATFQHRNRDVVVDGFYDGDGRYLVRFSPDQEGRWTYRTSSSVRELDGVRGELVVGPPGPGNHGPVRVAGTSHFRHADGTRHESFGTTCYHWTHTGDEEHEERTLQALAGSPFNKVRMCLLPTQNMRPPRLAFVGTEPGRLDKTRFDVTFFAHLERRIRDLQELQIEADLILFHPYDKGHWGVDDMSAEEDRFYLRYVVARLAAFRNVWWSISNEFDFNKAKTMADWDALLQHLQRIDPYRRLASIHNGTAMYVHASLYDFAKPWTTHQSIQHWDATLTAQWRAAHPKPVVIDEIGYEGDIDRRWGNLSGRDLTRRFWHTVTGGGFMGHGECYVDSTPAWISAGGQLVGESPARIAFLRQLVAEGPADWVAAREDGYRLDYFGERRYAHHDLELGEDEHLVDVIDTWEMTVTTLPGTYRGRCRIPLEPRPDLAVRVRRAA